MGQPQGVRGAGSSPRRGAEQLFADRLAIGRRRVLEQDVEVVGVPHQVLGERDRHAGRQCEPAPGQWVGRDGCDARGCGCLEVQRSPDDQAGVGGRADVVEQALGPPGHPHEGCHRALGVRHAEAGQPPGRGVGATRSAGLRHGSAIQDGGSITAQTYRTGR